MDCRRSIDPGQQAGGPSPIHQRIPGKFRRGRFPASPCSAASAFLTAAAVPRRKKIRARGKTLTRLAAVAPSPERTVVPSSIDPGQQPGGPLPVGGVFREAFGENRLLVVHAPQLEGDFTARTKAVDSEKNCMEMPMIASSSAT